MFRKHYSGNIQGTIFREHAGNIQQYGAKMEAHPLFGRVQILSPEAIDAVAETPLHQTVVHFQAATHKQHIKVDG
jgi:hypothetical protein